MASLRYPIIYIALFILCLIILHLSLPFKRKLSGTVFLNSNVIPVGSKQSHIDETKICYLKILNEWKKGDQIAWLEVANLVKVSCKRNIRLCTKSIINFIPYLETTPLNPEHKYYMIPRLQYVNDSCSVLTFGIGGDIDAERHIQMVLPQCNFTGFDPNEQYETLFTQDLKGKFVQTAVGGKNENNTILKLTKNNGWKASGNTKIRSASELLEVYHGKDKIVDILNIDVEGSEYSIFESILADKIFKNVCQFNVEFHPVWYHNTGFTHFDILDILISLIKDGTFIWVKSVVHSSQFFPSYFVNTKNNFCIEKYLKGRLL